MSRQDKSPCGLRVERSNHPGCVQSVSAILPKGWQQGTLGEILRECVRLGSMEVMMKIIKHTYTLVACSARPRRAHTPYPCLCLGAELKKTCSPDKVKDDLHTNFFGLFVFFIIIVKFQTLWLFLRLKSVLLSCPLKFITFVMSTCLQLHILLHNQLWKCNTKRHCSTLL